jgi:hypothetical protein
MDLMLVSQNNDGMNDERVTEQLLLVRRLLVRTVRPMQAEEDPRLLWHRAFTSRCTYIRM